jgi:cyclopropane fatty-acyl-phospholipid synthase-like methyltransferase
MRRSLESFPGDEQPLRVLGIPCGIPRDLLILAEILRVQRPELLNRIEYHGLDLDAAVLKLAKKFTAATPIPAIRYHQGDALVAETLPTGPFHCVVSTGLNEFLGHIELQSFFRNVFERLIPGGTFYTSATQREPWSDKLMRTFELFTRYHTIDELRQILGRSPWTRLQIDVDPSGLQVFVIAVK